MFVVFYIYNKYISNKIRKCPDQQWLLLARVWPHFHVSFIPFLFLLFLNVKITFLENNEPLILANLQWQLSQLKPVDV